MMKWWIYQRERFPLVAHAPLILAFSGCAVSYSALLVGTNPRLISYTVAFVVCLLMFMQLRIADEFKDAEKDARWRPYRPVPRGLISLNELGVSFVVFGLIQLALVLAINVPLVVILLVAWLYLLLMCVEFFCRDWLKARPILYLLTHMGIMPLVDWFATACHWMPLDQGMPRGLSWFLAASFFNGVVIEIGRKIRRTEDEEEGVETYSMQWGRRRAVAAWLIMLHLTFLCGWQASILTGYDNVFLWASLVTLFITVVVALTFLLANKRGKILEDISAIWTLVFYLTLGILPLWLRS